MRHSGRTCEGKSERGLRHGFFRGMLPNCSSNGRRARTHTKAHAKLSIPIPLFKMAHTRSCRLSLALFRKCRPDASSAITAGGGGGWWKRFRFSHLFMQHFAIVAFRVLCRSLSLCFARTFSNFIAVDFIRLFLFILPKIQCGKFSFVVFAVFQQQQLVSLCTCRMFCELKPSEHAHPHTHKQTRRESEREPERRSKRERERGRSCE